MVGDAARTLTYVPMHIREVVSTLLRNSAVATLRDAHRRRAPADAPLPPVKVIVALSDDALQLKLADEAGGIKRSSLVNVWSYRSLASSWWRPADGLSLPLARLYAKYFGGDLDFVPMEGYGTDCYVNFSRVGSEQIRPMPTARAGGGDERTAGLFDAQQRRIANKA